MRRLFTPVLCAAAIAAVTARADDQSEDLAKKLNNPIANLISVPFQENVDFGMGPSDHGVKSTLNIQPVIPISLGSDWNVISRTILPVTYLSDDVNPAIGDQFGLADTTQSFFFSPKEPGPAKLIWGVGPAFLLPTATRGVLGTERWAAGPTAVLLRQDGPVTAGMLVNHLWSFAGNKNRSQVSQTFFQPFVSYTTHTATSFTVNLESSYDWQSSQWTIPANFTVSQVLKLGPQIISVQLGYRTYISAPQYGPDWGLRLAVVLLFPK
ncbi:MAG: transporter [Myxococcota bacterium]